MKLWVVFGAIASVVIMGCSDNSQTQKNPPSQPIGILLPRAGDTLVAEEHGFVLAWYDPTKAGLISWEYSLDDKKSWHRFTTVDNYRDTDAVPESHTDDGLLQYSIKRWWPACDTLADTTIYVRASTYGGSLNVVRGPIVIR